MTNVLLMVTMVTTSMTHLFRIFDFNLNLPGIKILNTSTNITCHLKIDLEISLCSSFLWGFSSTVLTNYISSNYKRYDNI